MIAHAKAAAAAGLVMLVIAAVCWGWKVWVWDYVPPRHQAPALKATTTTERECTYIHPTGLQECR